MAVKAELGIEFRKGYVPKDTVFADVVRTATYVTQTAPSTTAVRTPETPLNLQPKGRLSKTPRNMGRK